MNKEFKQRVTIGMSKLHSNPAMEGVLSTLFGIWQNNQAGQTDLQMLLTFLGSWNDYSVLNLNHLMGQPSLNQRQKQQLQVVADQTLLEALNIWQRAFSRVYTSASDVKRDFDGQSGDNKKKLLSFLVRQLRKSKHNGGFDAFMKQLEQDNNEPAVSQQAQQKSASVKKEAALAKQRRSRSTRPRVVKPEEQVAQELSGDQKAITDSAKTFLDLRKGQGHYDRSFEDVNGKTDGHAWKPELHVGKSVSKAPNKQQLSTIYGYVLSDPQLGFMNRLKTYFSQTQVLEPHILEMVFSPKGYFSHLSYDAQIEAMYLITYFAPSNDWQTFADVCHGRYLSDLIYRRKRDWQDLATINQKNGLVSQFLSGTFPYALRETAFWFYLTRWGYIRANNSNLKDGPYLQADETAYSEVDQRILATIRQTKIEGGNSDANNAVMNRLLRLQQESKGREQQILSVANLVLGLFMYNQAMDAAYNPKLTNAKISAFDSKLVDKKLNQMMRANAVDLLVNNSNLSQYLVIINQRLAEMQKKQAEYEQTERQRKVK